jgi:hypothetical protein
MGDVMADDFSRDILKMQQYAEGLQSLLEGTNQAVSADVDGTDASGAIVAVLGGDGLPTSLTVDYDWKRHLRPEAFGNAVVQAAHAAANRRLEIWAQSLDEGGWAEQAEQLRQRIEAEPPADAPSQEEPAAGKPAAGKPATDEPAARPRSLDEVTREMLSATNDLDALLDAPLAQGVGTTGYGKLEVTLSTNGLVSCNADQFWVSDKTGEELTEALAIALAAAREDLARAVRATPVGQLGRLLDEALALLRDSAT